MTATKKKTVTAKTPKAKKEPKLKVVKAPKEPKAPKAPKVDESRTYIEHPNFDVSAREGEKSGAFIKRLLETNALTTAEIVNAVQDNFEGSKVGPADVAFHRLDLRKQGVELDLVRLDKEGNRYTRSA
jgi:hypothetical protein